MANTFRDVTYGVRVEDDGTRVVGNRFRGADAAHHAVVVGTPDRTTVLGRPVTRDGADRQQSTIRGQSEPVPRGSTAWRATTVGANRALGGPSGSAGRRRSRAGRS